MELGHKKRKNECHVIRDVRLSLEFSRRVAETLRRRGSDKFWLVVSDVIRLVHVRVNAVAVCSEENDDL